MPYDPLPGLERPASEGGCASGPSEDGMSVRRLFEISEIMQNDDFGPQMKLPQIVLRLSSATLGVPTGPETSPAMPYDLLPGLQRPASAGGCPEWAQ